jgi:UDP-N-acetylglucosamine 2-epimerase (non-hydrolysing)
MSKKLMIVLGTRPEVIKLAPVILLARARPEMFDTTVVATSQHRQMLDQMLGTFGIEVDVDLDIMRHDQNLAQLTSAAMEGLFPVVQRMAPDYVVVQGDTTTTLIGALAAFYLQVPVAHVEAGLRTYDKREPFPEEINRRLTTQIADSHFAPTASSRANLLREGIAPERVWVTGNTCIDALLHIRKRRSPENNRAAPPRRILLTAHRRENHGAPLQRICAAVLQLAEMYPQLRFTYPVHLNPRVREIVFRTLGGHPQVELVEPLEYEQFVLAMHNTDIILTDSGGIQEEAPSLGKPVLVLRDKTERPEGVEAGTLRLVGTLQDRIVEETQRLIEDESAYRHMAEARNPYGDGRAAERILAVLAND